jgi:hypothetical protein
MRRTGNPGAVRVIDSSAPSDANHTVASARRAKRDTSGISEPRNQPNDGRRPTRGYPGWIVYKISWSIRTRFS